MLMNLRNALMTGKRLPYQCELEYIQSSGTQYIDTGIIPDSKIAWTFDFQVVSYNDGAIGIFRQSPNRNFYINLFNSRVYVRYVGFSSSAGSTTSPPITSDNGLIVNGRNTFTMGGGSFGINGNTLITGIDGTNLDSSVDTFVLFAYNRNGAVSGYCNIKCYQSKIYNNGVLIQHLIPVLDWSGVACMYDRVTGKCFYNAGTGDFVVGPDKN